MREKEVSVMFNVRVATTIEMQSKTEHGVEFVVYRKCQRMSPRHRETGT